MARPTGRRFSDREETQRGSKNSRAVTREGLTNKNDRLPSGNARVIDDVRRDVGVLTREDRPSTGAARASQEAAKDRAASRLRGVGGAVAGALSAGVGIGRMIGEAGGDEVVKKVIEKSGLGKKIDDAVSGERVSLTKSAKERIDAGELNKKSDKDERVNKEDYPTYKKDTKSAEAFRKAFKEAKDDDKKSFTFEGRKYNTESKNYAKGGLVKHCNAGASVKAHNLSKKGKK